MFANITQGEAGDNMGCLLRGIKREQIKRGQVLIVPGSVKAVTKFQAQVYVSINRNVAATCAQSDRVQVLTKDEGGRYTPFMEHYRPQLYLRTADVSVGLLFPEGTEGAAEKMVGCDISLFGWLLTSWIGHAWRQCRTCMRSRSRCRC